MSGSMRMSASWGAFFSVMSLAMGAGGCGSDKSSTPAAQPSAPVSGGRSNSPVADASVQRFRPTLASFVIQGTSVTYALGHTKVVQGVESLPESKFYCSLNGSAFERCQERGAIPVSRLKPGLNAFQVEASVGGQFSGNPLYHEFFYGAGAPMGSPQGAL